MGIINHAMALCREFSDLMVEQLKCSCLVSRHLYVSTSKVHAASLILAATNKQIEDKFYSYRTLKRNGQILDRLWCGEKKIEEVSPDVTSLNPVKDKLLHTLSLLRQIHQQSFTKLGLLPTCSCKVCANTRTWQ